MWLTCFVFFLSSVDTQMSLNPDFSLPQFEVSNEMSSEHERVSFCLHFGLLHAWAHTLQVIYTYTCTHIHTHTCARKRTHQDRYVHVLWSLLLVTPVYRECALCPCVYVHMFVYESEFNNTVEPPNKGHFGDWHKFSWFVLCREIIPFGRFKMYCRNYTGTVSRVLCREVYYTVSSSGRVHYQRFTVCLHCHVSCRVHIFRWYMCVLVDIVFV